MPHRGRAAIRLRSERKETDLSDAVDREDPARAPERASPSPVASPVAGQALLAFYDRLRQRILTAVERRGGRLGEGTVAALLLVPDVFMLLVRLSLDREVPAATRALIGGALVYFVVPTDLLPEAMLGAGGYLDDLVLASAVLTQALSGELEPIAAKHWSGKQDFRIVLRDVAGAAHALLGESLYRRLQRVLSRRGIPLAEDDSGFEAPPRGRRQVGPNDEEGA
jgi:uncharacterized membrane protein YkvA (DUF1232 family)